VKLTIGKRAPDGSAAARDPGEVIAFEFPWVAVQAVWSYDQLRIDGLVFEPGAILLEWFSPDFPFNAFAVLSPDRQLRGWYANVTYPAELDDRRAPTRLIWHDLYLDLVGLPDGSFKILDEDELREAELETRDPRLLAMIERGRVELVRRFITGAVPFEMIALSQVAAPAG
jgi:hypothetical protein